MMRFIYILLLSIFFAVGGYAQVMQTTGGAGGNKFRALKADSFLVVPSGADTSNLANPKYGEGTTGALFVKTTDSTLWFKVGGRWVQASGGSSGPGGGGITNISYRAGSVVDTLYYTDSGGDTDWYFVIQKQGLIAGGIVSYAGFERTYYVTAAIYRIGDDFYSTSDTTITLAALASPDSSRSDVFVVNTSSQTTTVTGVESANPLVPQTDPATQVFLTHVTLTSSNPDAGVDTVVIYDENIEWTGSATGVTVNFNGASNVYRGTKTTDVSSINSGDIIVYTNGSAINRLSHAGVSFFIRLKQAMPNNNNITVSFWNGSTQVSSAVNIPINKTNTTSYQGLSLGMEQFTWSNNLFDRVRFTYSGSGISGLYLDFVYLVDGIVVVSPSNDFVQNIRRVGDDIEQQKGGVFTKVFDISDKGTVSSVGSGYGLLGGPITTTGTLSVDTFAISTRGWRDKLKDSLGAVKLNISDTSTMLAGYVRSAYRKAGSDSVFVVKAGGASFAFRDSIGGGGGLTIDSVVLRRYGWTTAQNIRSWNAGARTAAANGIGSANTTTSNDSTNIVIGYNAGNDLTTGYRNIYFGYRSGFKSTTAYGNIGLGFNTVGSQSASAFTGNGNIGIGTAQTGNTTGPLSNLTSGNRNIAIGGIFNSTINTGNQLTSGGNNILIGHGAGWALTTTSENTFIGSLAGYQATGTGNTLVGSQTAQAAMSSSNNTIVGYQSGIGLTSGTLDAFGYFAGRSFTTGTDNFSIGRETVSGSGSTVTGSGNMVLGIQSATLPSSTPGITISRNTYVGNYTARNTTSGADDNTFIGYASGTARTSCSGCTNLTGASNISIGSWSLLPSLTSSNQITFWVGGSTGYNAMTRFTGGGWLINNTTSAVTAATASTALEINGTTGAVLFPRLTTTQRDALTATDGMVIYNTSTSKLQVRAGGAWVDLH
jgi:hypothetical protein